MTERGTGQTPDWAALYRDNVRAVGELAGDLTEEQLSTTVPGTPAWTVRDLVSHLAGGAADAVAGRMDGAPGPEWTARHVAERRAMSVADLVAELHTNEDAVAASAVDNPRPAIVWDVAVHHADLHEALWLGILPAELWAPVLTTVAPMRFGTAGVPDDLDDYELFRAIFSRRSRTQMQAWGLPLTGDQLDDLCIFGPRDDDQPVP